MTLLTRREIVVNDDYSTTDSKQLVFTSTTWPATVGATISFIVEEYPHAATAVFTVTATRVSATVVNCDLTTANTTLLTAGRQYRYRLVSVISARDMTLEEGVIEAR